MAISRRSFLESSAAAAVGLAGAAAAPGQTADVQVPKVRFFKTEISRMVLGVNPFYGFAHYNRNFASAMKDWYTEDRVCEVMRRCNRFGINAFNYVNLDRARAIGRGSRPKAARCT
jgi:hypothetical protein